MLTLNQLSFGYPRQAPLFNELSWSLPASGVYGLLGKNGAGKTTLLKIMAGLIFPTAGVCQVNGYMPQARQPAFLSQLYFLPEDIFVPAINMQEYLNAYARFYPQFDHAQFATFAKEFDLDSHKALAAFSYGQKKKFLIAFGLATQTQVLIMDEPTNGLDIPSKAQFKKMLASVIKEDRLIIISTHQVHDIENLIDSITILDSGKILFNQTLNNISHKLNFSLEKSLPEAEQAIYFEKQLGGYITVNTNTSRQESPVDLEVLFNAVLTNQAKIQQLFEVN